jgi:protein-disulfide isomerase
LSNVRLRVEAWAAAIGGAASRILAAVLLLAATGFGSPPPADAGPAGEPSREAVERIVREYLLSHPEVLEEALGALQQRRAAAERQRQTEALKLHEKELLRDPAAPVGGNPGGDATVVEFFDYRCGYCKSVAPVVRQLLQRDRQVRLVYKELPVLGPESVLASRAALAAVAQGKYAALHDALLDSREPLNRPVIIKIAGQVGLDVARLEKDMDSPETMVLIRRNQELARVLGIKGTPAFVVGGQLVPGAVDLATLERLVEEARRR